MTSSVPGKCRNDHLLRYPYPVFINYVLSTTFNPIYDAILFYQWEHKEPGEMSYRLLVLVIFGCHLSSSATSHREDGTRPHYKAAAHAHSPAGSHASHKSSTVHAHSKAKHTSYQSPLHKKEEMMGQDTMRINDAEFKLQSLISPEFHQGRAALNGGKPFRGLEMNTLSPEQVAFVQSTSQWPKFFQPQPSKSPTKTIYPEDPVLFPNEGMGSSSRGAGGASNWFNGMDVTKQGASLYNDAAMWSGRISPTFSGMQKGRHNPGMVFEERPSYVADGDPPIGAAKSILGVAKASSNHNYNTLEELNDGADVLSSSKGFTKQDNFIGRDDSKFLNEDLAMASSSIYGPSKNRNSFESLFNEGPREGHGIGRPVGILRNILQASKSMLEPTGSIRKPSPRSWLNNGPFSRRQRLEKVKGAVHEIKERKSSKASQRRASAHS